MLAEWLKFLVEALKLLPRYLAPVGIVAAVLLFVPAQHLQVLGVAQFAEDQRPVLGLIFLFCAAAAGIAVFRAGPWMLYLRWRRQWRLRQRLHRLTEDEKDVLRGYMARQSRSGVLCIDDGVTQGLVADAIIYRASSVGTHTRFAHNIPQDVWQIRQKDQSVLR